MPGAVPLGLGITRLPSGNMAWISFCGGIARLRRANSPRMYSSADESNTNFRPVARASSIPSKIVGRWPEPAGGHDQIGTAEGLPEDFGDRLQFVTNRRVIEHADAELFQAQAQPLAVRIEELATGNLVADGDDFGMHGELVRK